MKIVALILIACCCASGQWNNVTGLPVGKTITVEKKGGETVKGEFVNATEQALTIHSKQQDVSVARADVVRLETKRNGHAKWWGLAIGAGAGAAVGGPVGSRIANESGGDFNNLKGAIVAIVAAAGALIGLAIGAGLDARHSTIYKS